MIVCGGVRLARMHNFVSHLVVRDGGHIVVCDA